MLANTRLAVGIASVLGICTILPLLALAQTGTWTLQHPFIPISTIYEVQFLDETMGWAVSHDGQVLKTENGGESWSSQWNVNAEIYRSVHFVDEQVGWIAGVKFAAGAGAVIRKTTDGGATWLNVGGSEAGNLNDIYFSDANTGWAVGNSGIDGLILKTEDGGDSWQAHRTEVSGLESIFFVSDSTGWVTGSSRGVMKTVDAGNTWFYQDTGVNEGLATSFFVNQDTGWVAGQGRVILRTDDGGASWDEQRRGPGGSLESLFFIDENVGWAAGSIGSLFKTEDGGETWTSISTDFRQSFESIVFANREEGWISGFTGTMIRTTDGGETWKSQSSITGEHLYNAQQFTDSLGLVSGAAAAMLRTGSAGKNWLWQDIPTNRSLFSMHFLNSELGWAGLSSGKMLKTTNGGREWQFLSTPATTALHGLFFVNDYTGWAVGGGALSRVILRTNDGGETWDIQLENDEHHLTDVYFANDSLGWAVGSNGTLLSTSNGGISWEERESGMTGWIERVLFVSESKGFLIGSSGLSITYDGGESWEKLAVGPGWIDDISFIDENIGWAVGTVAGSLSKSITGDGLITLTSFFGARTKLWYTVDGGVNWSQNTLDHGAWGLSGDFLHANSGFVVGTNGTILKYADELPIPNSPTNLSLSSSETEVLLSWNDSAIDESSYVVSRREGHEYSYSVMDTLNANAQGYIDTAFERGRRYWYKVHATNATGNSGATLDVYATPQLNGPTELFLTVLDNQQVQLTWQDNSSHEMGFVVERRLETNDDFSAIDSLSANVVEYIDQHFDPALNYYYRVVAVDSTSRSRASNEAFYSTPTNLSEDPASDLMHELFQNFPNPFRLSTRIKIQLSSSDNIRLAIYNLLGEEVTTLLQGTYSPGPIHVTWDGLDASGKPAPSGIYVYQLLGSAHSDVKQMVLVR